MPVERTITSEVYERALVFGHHWSDPLQNGSIWPILIEVEVWFPNSKPSIQWKWLSVQNRNVVHVIQFLRVRPP